MKQNILIIGGTRYFGKLLVQQLVEQGHQVTIATRGQVPDPFGDKVNRVRVDRRDIVAMTAAFKNTPVFDVIYDQMCYTPLDAQVSVLVFSGRVKRYVMASTIEVYNQQKCSPRRGFVESDFDGEVHPYELAFPWHDEHFADATYAEGKRQAEAYFAQNADFDVVPVRIGHVISVEGDFTGRVAFYRNRLSAGQSISHSAKAQESAFITPQLLVQFLIWVGRANVRGPINASAGELSVFDLVSHLAKKDGFEAKLTPALTQLGANTLSPFDYPQPFVTNMDQATKAGFCFCAPDNDLSGFAGLLPKHEGEI